MNTAIVTGASSGIGLSIAVKLIDLGYKVYGIARDFSKIDYENSNFIKVCCDITDTPNLTKEIKRIRKEEDIYILVNNAGIGYFGMHEEINPAKLSKMVATNFQAPLVITHLLLRSIKKSQGYIINISSITATKPSRFGCAYAATKAGISHFSISLYEEVRKYGVKVVTIQPDMTKTNFYDNSNFREGDDEESYITPDCVAKAVETILTQRDGTIITNITIQPQKHMIKRK
ncbi:SDR family NAD(P)-dependent oxidoreductase [Abyssisolibacter fermentans]|uniref:SDR family NAD(P)-dependent oxidoreductase n=1 Tax=Abyssisolibacter fermentans TaxID=1766203 RepID=UPI0008346CE2|nr:SDR family NAD(P)-dependent oxidoreductase [Abyssisolibacter fermentans]